MILSETQCEGRSKAACCLCDLECYFRVAESKLDDAGTDRLLDDILDGEQL